MNNECTILQEIIKKGKRLVVYLHDNPDPDAICSGWLLQRIGVSCGVRTIIVYGGRLGRAENRTMAKALKIPLRSLEKEPIRILPTDCVAMVDTQPMGGNNSLPEGRHCHIVIDHHPQQKLLDVDLLDIRPEIGSCSTILLDYYRSCNLEIDHNLATAAAYAIASETQDLEREATRADKEAYHAIFPLVRLNIMGRIRHPVRSRAYYRTIARAMLHVQVGRNTCVCHIGEVTEAEVVAEVADLLMPMERITWCLVSGWHAGTIIFSIRTKHPKGRAQKVIRKALGHLGRGGGHGMIAGGSIPCPDPANYQQLVNEVGARFVDQLNHKFSERMKPLLAEDEAEHFNGNEIRSGK